MSTHEEKRHRRLTIAVDAPGDLARHPDDGFVMADPRPMGRASLRVLDAIVGAVLPPAPAPHEPGLEQEIAHSVRVMMQYMPPLSARGFVWVMHLLNWSPLWRLRGLLPLTRISTQRASSVLRGIANSRFLYIRLLMLGPKGLVLSSYFDRDEVHRELRYDPTTFIRARIELRERLLAGGEATPEDDIAEPPGLVAISTTQPEATT
ncbi:MAG: hypothetical protein GXP55_04785 [Deltaproteobacteria bacterium]|nr:hypothetical protein [Deltaproteobacteria bacterium]